MAHGAEEATELAAVRTAQLALPERLLSGTLHDFNRQQPYFSRTKPFEKPHFAEYAGDWRREVLSFSSQVSTLSTTLDRVAQRYFEGTPLNLNQERQQLEALEEM